MSQRDVVWARELLIENIRLQEDDADHQTITNFSLWSNVIKIYGLKGSFIKIRSRSNMSIAELELILP